MSYDENKSKSPENQESTTTNEVSEADIERPFLDNVQTPQKVARNIETAEVELSERDIESITLEESIGASN